MSTDWLRNAAVWWQSYTYEIVRDGRRLATKGSKPSYGCWYEIREDHIRQDTGGPFYRIERIKAAKQMLGAR